MEYTELPGVLLKASRLVLGGRFGEQDDVLSYELLDEFVSLGGNVIDTANAYVNGMSERLIGKWFAERNNREKIVLIDKGCHPTDDKPTIKRVNPKAIKDDIAESLERLNTSYIDIFLLHRDDETFPVEPIIDALNEELSNGRIMSFGASNWNVDRINQANDYAAGNGLKQFSVSSNGFSLAIPNEPMWPGAVHVDNDRCLNWYIKSKMPLIAWSSQARGWFSGEYDSGKRYDKDVERVYKSRGNLERLERAKKLAEKMNVKPIQIALAYVLNKGINTLAIIGPQSFNELHDSVDAMNLKLNQSYIQYLEDGICDLEI